MGPFVLFKSPRTALLEAQAGRLGMTHPKYQKLRRRAAKLNALEAQKLFPYLEAFYRDRQVPYTQHLIVQSFGPTAHRLMCQGAEAATHGSENSQARPASGVQSGDEGVHGLCEDAGLQRVGAFWPSAAGQKGSQSLPDYSSSSLSSSATMKPSPSHVLQSIGSSTPSGATKPLPSHVGQTLYGMV